MTLQATIWRELPDGTEAQTPVLVEYDFHPATGDGRDEPRESAWAEVIGATDPDGREVRLTAWEAEEMASRCYAEARGE